MRVWLSARMFVSACVCVRANVCLSVYVCGCLVFVFAHPLCVRWKMYVRWYCADALN